MLKLSHCLAVLKNVSWFSGCSYEWQTNWMYFVSAPSLSNGTIKEEELSASPDYFIKCPQCQKCCQSFQALKEHMEIAHTDLTATSENSLSIASAVSPTLGGSTGGRYTCAQCSTNFSSKEQLEKHELLHSPNAQVVSTDQCWISAIFFVYCAATISKLLSS